MDLNQTLKILIDCSLKGQKFGLYSVYESRDLANAIDFIESLSKPQEQKPVKENKKATIPLTVPPVSSSTD